MRRIGSVARYRLAMRWCLLGLFWLASCASPAVLDDARFELFVLGVAQDGGVPHLGCDKVCCAEARASGQRRFPVSLGVHDRETGGLLLIEASPAIEAQVALLQELAGRTGRGRRPVDAVMITHAHIGHYLGLAQLGREVAGVQALPVFVTPRFGEYLRSHGPWRQLVDLGQIELRESEPGSVFEPLPGLRVRSVAVPHRDEFSDTMAFRIEGPNRTVLFVPDIDRWERAGDTMAELFDDVDIAYVDGTFYDGSELPS